MKLRCLSLQPKKSAFTLIELLIVVAIIAILAAIAVVNLRQALERSYIASNSANMRTIAVGLQIYLTDFGKLPPADREAGPFQSHTTAFTNTGNGPAGGGSWDGIPWLLLDNGYVENEKYFFNPKYLKEFRAGETIRGNHPRYHNFRYAYNASALSSGGLAGGSILSGDQWVLRDLHIAPEDGFYGGSYPNYPADYDYPWNVAVSEPRLEHVIYLDSAVKLVRGGTNTLAQ